MLKRVTHFLSSNSTVTACFEKSLSMDKDTHNIIDNSYMSLTTKPTVVGSSVTF
jgi:hypothetical protein